MHTAYQEAVRTDAHEGGPDNEQFQENLVIAQDVREAGGFSEYTKELDGFTDAFEPQDAIRCSDEGETHEGHANPGSFLYDLFVTQVDPDTLAGMYHRQGIKKLVSHGGCGAAKIALTSLTGRTPSWDEVDAWAEDVTRQFCRTYNFEHGHTPSTELNRPEHFHPATAIYLDYVGGFQPQNVAGIEQGYLVSAAISRDPIGSVAVLLQNVAFGKGNAGDLIKEMRAHGQWALFNVYIIARTDAEAAEKVAAVHHMLHTLDPAIAACINVESTVVSPSVRQ